VQKNQQMLSGFFFSACEVLKAGSSVKLFLSHANYEVIIFVHAESHFASLQAPLIRLYGHIEHVLLLSLALCNFVPQSIHDHVRVHTCHAVIDM